MKVAFVHDHVFQVAPDGSVWSDGKLPYKAWSRYLAFARELVVVGRSRRIEQVASGLARSDGPQVSFRFVSIPVVRSPSMPIQDCDAVVARLPSRLGHRAVHVAVRSGKPWAAEVVQDPKEAFSGHGGVLARIYEPIATHMLRRDLRRATHAIYVTGRTLQQRYPTNGQQIAASNVDIPTPDPFIARRRIERAAQPVKTIGLVGNLTPIKGIDLLIQMLPRFPGLRARVLGAGDAAPWMELAKRAGVGDRIQFDGVLPPGGPVLKWLDEIDLYVQPSRAEGLPRGLIEAMSRACPAVAARVGGTSELLPDHYLHQPGDAEGFASALRPLIEDGLARREAAEQNFGKAQEFSADVLTARRAEFWATFAKFVSSRRGGA